MKITHDSYARIDVKLNLIRAPVLADHRENCTSAPAAASKIKTERKKERKQEKLRIKPYNGCHIPMG